MEKRIRLPAMVRAAAAIAAAALGGASGLGFGMPAAAVAASAAGTAESAATPLAAPGSESGTGPGAGGTWSWPLPQPDRVVEAFRAPATPYAAGHRGVDFAAVAGQPVSAPASGVVLFAGTVVDRPIMTLQLDDGALLSFEPLRADAAVGARVTVGARLGWVAAGGHCDARCLHLGVRIDGAYLSPMLFFAAVPAAVLLPLD